MIVTNKTNLPQPIVAMATRLLGSHPKMERNEFSVTELEKGTKEMVLLRRHGDECEMDVQDSYSLWSGTLVHELLSDASDDYINLSEERFKIDLRVWDDTLAGVTLSGGVDLYNKKTGVISDYKNSKVAQYEKCRNLEERTWFYQLMAYKKLLTSYGYEVKGIENVVMMKDHSKVKASTNPNYPQNPIAVIDYTPMMDVDEFIEEAEGFFIDKAHMALEAQTLADDEIAPCTPSERFEDVRWAVQKKGATRATKNFKTEAEARVALETYGDKYEVERKVGGKPTKCLLYCSCNKFCSFYRDYMEGSENE